MRDSRRSFDRRITPTGNESTLDIRGSLPKRVMIIGVLVALGILSFAIVLLAVGKSKPPPADDPAVGPVEEPPADAAVPDTIAVIPIDSADERAQKPDAPATEPFIEVHSEPDRVARNSGRTPTGKLTAKTTPSSAVFLNGKKLGDTPADLDLAPGVYMLTFKNPRLQAVTKRVTITAGKTTKLAFSL